MAPFPRTLLDLRGHVVDPAIPESDLPEGRTLYWFVKTFPVSDELAVLVFPTGACLVNVRTRKVFWSIVCCLTDAALDPARNLLALANAHKLYLWDLTTGKLAQSWEAPSAVADLAFSPDGALLATALWDAPDVVLWRVADGQEVQRFQQEDDPYGCMKSLALSPDGTLLALGNYEDSRVWVWKLAQDDGVRNMETHPAAQRIHGLAFSPDSKLLVGGEFAGPDVPYLHAWDVQTGRLLPPFPAKSWLPTFHPAGTLLASPSSLANRQIVLWDVASRTPLRTCGSGELRTHSLAFSPSGSTLVTCGEDCIAHWWNTKTGQEIYRVEARFSVRPGAALTADTCVLATSTRDGSLRLWETSTGKQLAMFGIPSLQDEGIAIDAQASMCLSWSHNEIGPGSLHLWRPTLGTREGLRGTQQWVYQAALSPDGMWAAAICGDTKVRLWSLREPATAQHGIAFRRPQATLGLTPVHAPLAFRADGSWLATVNEEQQIQIWETSTAACIQTLAGTTSPVTSLTFSADGQLLAAGSADGGVQLWQMSDGRMLQHYRGLQQSPLHLAFDAGGTRLGVVNSAGEIRVWQVEAETSHAGKELPIREQAFTLTGSSWEPGSEEESIHLWEFSPGMGQAQITLPHVQLLALAFRTDGSVVVAGCGYGQTDVWRLEHIPV